MDTRSFMRAAVTEVAGTVPADASAMQRKRNRRSFISKREQAEQDSVQEEGAADGIAHYALAVHFHFELAEPVGEHAVGGVDIGGADHAAYRDGLVFGVDLDV